MVTYRWLVMLPPINGFDQTNIWAEQVSLPVSLQISNRPVFFGGLRPKFSDFGDGQDMQITFYEDQTMGSYSYFLAWQKLVLDDNGYYGVKSEYALPIYAFLYSTTDNSTEVKQYKVNSCWPTVIHSYNLSYETSGRLQTTISFSCDNTKDNTSASATSSSLVSSITSFLNTTISTAQSSAVAAVNSTINSII